MKFKTLFAGTGMLFILFSGCESNDDPSGERDYSQGIYIVNEGTFQSNNGSISYYEPREGVLINGIFEASNGRALGDVVQSMSIVGDTTGIIVVNNSGKLEVIDLRNFKTIADPVPVNYPRYFIPVTSDKGYLSGGNLRGFIYDIDLRTFTIRDSIPAGYGPEIMVKLGDMVYVANSGGWAMDSTIYEIYAQDNRMNDTIYVGKAPADLVFDGSGYLWVHCKGQAIYNWDPPYELISETDALLQKVDVQDGTILWQGVVGKAGDYTASPPRIGVSPDGEDIYYLRPDGVYRLTADDPSIPQTVWISGSFYGLDVNPDNGDIYVFEASFTGNGRMRIFNENGMPLTEGIVGIAPSGAVFH